MSHAGTDRLSQGGGLPRQRRVVRPRLPHAPQPALAHRRRRNGRPHRGPAPGDARGRSSSRPRASAINLASSGAKRLSTCDSMPTPPSAPHAPCATSSSASHATACSSARAPPSSSATMRRRSLQQRSTNCSKPASSRRASPAPPPRGTHRTASGGTWRAPSRQAESPTPRSRRYCAGKRPSRSSCTAS